MWVSTFHSACARILRREARLLGYRSSFSIYDESDATRLVDYVRRDMNLDPKRFPPRRLHGAISAMKNELIGPEQALADGDARQPEKRLADIYVEYQKRLAEASAADFDDLLLLVVRLFREHPDALEPLAAPLRATSSSTSSRTRTSPSGSSSASSPRSTATSWSSATRISASSPGTSVTMADRTTRPDRADRRRATRSSPTTAAATSARRASLRVHRSHGDRGHQDHASPSGRELVSTPEHTHFAGYLAGFGASIASPGRRGHARRNERTAAVATLSRDAADGRHVVRRAARRARVPPGRAVRQ